MELETALLVEMGIVVLVLSAMSGIAWKVGLSAAPLFLIAGLLGGEGGLVTFSASEDFLEVAAGVGVILLLLALGLEFSVGEFQESMKLHAPTGVVDFVLNATPGLIAGLLLGWETPAALALAGITYISSSGIIARLLSDLGRLGNRETPTVLSVLVLEDLAMAAFLPFLGVVLVGGHLLAGIAGSAFAVALTVGVIVLLQRAEKVATWVFDVEDDERVLFRLLGLTFLVAGLAHWAGISSAVGAFLVGLAVPPSTVGRVRVILRPLRDLFAAVFFFVFGLQINAGELLPVLPVALVLAVLTAFTKMGTGWYGAKREGVGVRGRVRAGTALIARGEFSVVMAGLAVSAGFVDVGPMASAYVLLLAVCGPLLARSADWISGKVFPAEKRPAPVTV